MLSERSLTQKEYIHDPTYMKLQKWQNCCDRKHEKLRGPRDRGRKLTVKRHKAMFLGDKHALYGNFAGDFMTVYICQVTE